MMPLPRSRRLRKSLSPSASQVAPDSDEEAMRLDMGEDEDIGLKEERVSSDSALATFLPDDLARSLLTTQMTCRRRNQMMQIPKGPPSIVQNRKSTGRCSLP